MFAIIDLSRRASRGQILMIVDDQAAATAIARELNQGSTQVTVQLVTAQQVEAVVAGAHAGPQAARSPAIA